MTGSSLPTASFGNLLRHLRKRMGMTQGELAAKVGYSTSFISALEKEQRLPDVEFVVKHFLPVLALEDEPHLAARLVESAALARGERPPETFTLQRSKQIVIEEKVESRTDTLVELPTILVGRQEELSQICDRLLHHAGRLLTLVGPPGVGKTTLALAAAHSVQHFFRDGCHFVALAAINNPDLLADTVLQVVGVTPTGNKSPTQQLIENLRRKECLLIVDNFEQLLSLSVDEVNKSVGFVAELVAQCPSVRILVTSRERLHLRAEQRQTISPLKLAAAVEFFALRAEAILDSFALTSTNRPFVESICKRLDCLPLAIELTAPRIEILTLAQILEQLQDRALDLLRDGARDLPAHHRTLRIAIQQSYTLLGDAAQQIFRQLSIFSGGFTLRSAEKIVQRSGDEDLLSVLQSLLAKSLIHCQRNAESETRFLLLETVREFTLEKLQLAGEETECRQRHAHYFLKMVVDADAAMATVDKPLYLEHVEADFENVRSGWHWFVAHDPAQSLHMAALLKEFWYSRGYVQEGKLWLQTSLAANPAPSLDRGRALVSLAQLVQNQGDYAAAHASLEESIAIFQTLGNVDWQAEALRELGWVDYNDNQPNRAVTHWQRATELLAGSDRWLPQAMLFGHIAHVLVEQPNEIERAKAVLRRSIAFFQRAPATHEAAYIFNVQANLCNHEGDIDGAAEALRQAMALHEQLGVPRDLAWSQLELGEVEMMRSNLGEGCALLRKALAYFEQVDDLSASHFACFHIAQAERKRRNWDLAQVGYLRSQKAFEQLSNDKMVARCFIGLSALAVTQGDPLRASELLAQAQSLMAALPDFLYPADQREFDELKEQLANYVHP